MANSFDFPRQSNDVMNFGLFLTQTARRLPDESAIIKGGKSISWSAFNQSVDALAHALREQGVGVGDSVLLHSPNCPEMAVAMYAVFKLGAVLVPTNFRLKPDEIAQCAQIAKINAYIGHADFPEHIAAIEETGVIDDRQIIIGRSFDTLVSNHLRNGAFREAKVKYNDPAWFFFTSGTTGTPKCAVLTHGQLAFVINNHAADLMPGLSHRDRSLVIAPLSHGAGLHFFVQVARGAASILLEKPGLDEEEVWQLVEKHRITNLFTVPTIIKRLTEHQAIDSYDYSSLKHVVYAGAPMYREDQKNALRKLGPVLVQYFGLGEVTGAITVLPPDEHDIDDAQMRVGSCGYARLGMEIAILDEKNTHLEPNMTGLVAVRGPAVCSGYYNNKAANESAFVNGWFITGDIGHMDEAGHLYLTDRQSDMYISGGSNIYPREIEEKLLEHPDIAQVAVLGIPDAQWGEVGAAIIVLNNKSNMDESMLRAWFSDKISRYKHPKLIVFKDDLPKSGYGKIEKKRLRKLLRDEGYIEDLH